MSYASAVAVDRCQVCPLLYWKETAGYRCSHPVDVTSPPENITAQHQGLDFEEHNTFEGVHPDCPLRSAPLLVQLASSS